MAIVRNQFSERTISCGFCGLDVDAEYATFGPNANGEPMIVHEDHRKRRVEWFLFCAARTGDDYFKANCGLESAKNGA